MAQAPQVQQTSATPSRASPDYCVTEGPNREKLIEQQRPRAGLTLLMLDDAGNLCYSSRDFGVVGDPIYVGIVTTSDVAWEPVRFESCSLEPSGPRVFVGAGSFPTAAALGTGHDTILMTGPRRCYNVAVDIVTKQSGTSSAEHRYSLQQYQRYEATLQFGILFTAQHDQTFGLRPDTGNIKRIFSQGPSGNGAEYVATVVLYALPKQILQAFGGGVRGRDIIHDNSFLDRIGGVIGVGLTNPGRRFVAGVTFEVFNGVSALASIEFARVKQLAGVSEGAVFSGAAADIPTQDVWTHTAITWGLTIDLRYVTALFSHQ
jgi:hypothetical protein